MAPENVTLRIFRYDPFHDPEPYYAEYVLPVRQNDQLLDLLEEIKTVQDHTLNYRRSCRHGICGSCAMKVQGKPVLACSTPVRELVREFGPKLTIEPLNSEKVIRDLISDMDDFWDAYSRTAPYLEPLDIISREESTISRRLYRGSTAAIGDSDHCIMCGACYAACPVVPLQPSFLGPAALTRTYRFIKDVRDAKPDRLKTAVAAESGAWECIKCLKCTEACPKEIDPFSKVKELHSRAFQAGDIPGGIRSRHTVGFQLNLLLNGLLNELPLAVFSMRFRVLGMARRGIRMFFHGKIILNPLRPRSRGHRQIRRLMRKSQ